MTMKTGVNVIKIDDRLSDILPYVEYCVKACGGGGSIITSAREKENGRFVDRHNVLVVEIENLGNVLLACKETARIIGPDYKIVADHGLIRITWDPINKEGNDK
ncbi:hypothetical protein ES703_80719 [subsurface metagenome]